MQRHREGTRLQVGARRKGNTERERLGEQLERAQELAARAVSHARALELENEALFEQGMGQARRLREVEEELQAVLEGSGRLAERIRQLEATLQTLADAEQLLQHES